jgi:hypothetical protein
LNPIRAEALEPIPPRLSEEVFRPRLEGAIKEASNRLLAEGDRELAASARPADWAS